MSMHTVLDQYQCCCNQSDCNKAYGVPCAGVLKGNVCPSTQILRFEYDGMGYFGYSKPVNTEGMCYAPDGCYKQNWQ